MTLIDILLCTTWNQGFMANRVYISVLDPIWESVKQEHLIRVLSVQYLLIFG